MTSLTFTISILCNITKIFKYNMIKLVVLMDKYKLWYYQKIR